MKIYDLYWFLGIFGIIYLFYLIRHIIGKNKKYNPDRVPQELAYLIRKYRLDMKKIKYRVIMNQIGLASAFDVAFVATFMFCFIKNTVISILVGGIMFIPLIIITFGYIGKHYEKKGMVINGYKKN